MTFGEELKSRNFSIYGQWTGVLCIILCFAIGLSNVFSSFIVFGIISLVYSPILLFIEVPFLLRICPTSSKFDSFIRRFTTSFMRAAVYVAMSAGLWVSLIIGPSSLICPAVFLAIAAIFYLLAGVMKQEFTTSKTLGGQGVAQMIV
ncbi:Golgi apparatus membrane protein tvp18 [Ophidiomyces ophidiicola]|nr:Golgi apparatus membrane protein tvp18 [Ophidiomyces ophidiicola]KAI1923652.1 Golgi apparatus membrane protein tvp18 [Ophidiomyces ophidiicola]KAI1975230.1 Golgi apparatus membrane protein tvp18 [Ophidiomyces ophidiicola]KAI1986535.1 Golgi apparatus membrane protein tvp18 [Ophidiomyces ophidiicola]KAI1997294.1 Golgi apparatus membrane protein tvp18 [Ophidiomyces ophidiicola]